MVIALATGDYALWLSLGAGVGLILGFIMWGAARRRKRVAFHGTARPVAHASPPAANAPEVKRAA